jgi:Multicopper oxidase
MKGANGMDGVVGVTQQAILPGEDFTYDFVISNTQAGTFWYSGSGNCKEDITDTTSGIILTQSFSEVMVCMAAW